VIVTVLEEYQLLRAALVIALNEKLLGVVSSASVTTKKFPVTPPIVRVEVPVVEKALAEVKKRVTVSP
jgi:hypothetical protein